MSGINLSPCFVPALDFILKMGRFCLLSDIRVSKGQGLAELENRSPCGYEDAGGELLERRNPSLQGRKDPHTVPCLCVCQNTSVLCREMS